MSRKVAVVGLGYVGLPLALAFAKKHPGTVGFDISTRKVGLLKRGVDVTQEGNEAELQSSQLLLSSAEEDLRGCDFFVVAVPTPIDVFKMPDLAPIRGAAEIVGRAIRPGGIAVFESTVYPGVTEEICGPIIEKISGLKCGRDFTLGYSPERINPGDKEHTLARVVKVVSGQNAATLSVVADLYGSIIDAGVYQAESIKVAEAAKVIENTQRDLNIALMNELALIFDRMGISTHAVLSAAGTKWNFLRFQPGLVGGHCIGVDPYYLTTKAQELGYHPRVILAGRQINDDMGKFVAQKLVKLLANRGIQLKGARVGILGITFKENIADVRNSRVPDIVRELQSFGIRCLVQDPLADAESVREEYGLDLCPLEELTGLDGLLGAVAHNAYRRLEAPALLKRLRENAVLVDIKSMFREISLPPSITYWSL